MKQIQTPGLHELAEGQRRLEDQLRDLKEALGQTLQAAEGRLSNEWRCCLRDELKLVAQEERHSEQQLFHDRDEMLTRDADNPATPRGSSGRLLPGPQNVDNTQAKGYSNRLASDDTENAVENSPRRSSRFSCGSGDEIEALQPDELAGNKAETNYFTNKTAARRPSVTDAEEAVASVKVQSTVFWSSDHIGKWAWVCRPARLLVHTYGNRFEHLMGILIIVNTITLGVEIQVSLDNDGRSDERLEAMEQFFLTCFVVELIIRLSADGRACFKNHWFVLDFVLVSTGVCAAWILGPIFETDSAQTVPELDVLQQFLIIRILRLIRLVRALRLLDQFKELWKLTSGLIRSGRTVLSALSLVLVTIYGFACLGVELIFKAEDFKDNDRTGPIVNEYFSSLPRTMLTLVAFANADSIAQIYAPLCEVQPLLALYFCAIWLVVTISLMNLVTAVIVENAISNAAEDQEMQRHQMRKQLKKLIPQIKDIFSELDKDGEGTLTYEELHFSNRDWPEELKPLIQSDKLMDLFEFLDMDESGEIDIKEWVDGVCHLALSSVPIETTQILQLLRSQSVEIAIIKEKMGQSTPELNRRGLAPDRLPRRKSLVERSEDAADRSRGSDAV